MSGTLKAHTNEMRELSKAEGILQDNARQLLKQTFGKSSLGDFV